MSYERRQEWETIAGRQSAFGAHKAWSQGTNGTAEGAEEGNDGGEAAEFCSLSSFQKMLLVLTNGPLFTHNGSSCLVLFGLPTLVFTYRCPKASFPSISLSLGEVGDMIPCFPVMLLGLLSKQRLHIMTKL
jgi:hypothetical protein